MSALLSVLGLSWACGGVLVAARLRLAAGPTRCPGWIAVLGLGPVLLGGATLLLARGLS